MGSLGSRMGTRRGCAGSCRPSSSVPHAFPRPARPCGKQGGSGRDRGCRSRRGARPVPTRPEGTSLLSCLTLAYYKRDLEQ